MLVLLVLGGSAMGGCGGGDDAQLTDARVEGQCPSRMLQGKAVTFSVTVENTGEQDWPAVFVEWDGLRNVLQEKVTDGSGKKGRYWGGETYRFGRLTAGATQTYELTVTPVESAEKSDVTFAAWGDEPDGEPFPTAPEIEIHPCDELRLNTP